MKNVMFLTTDSKIIIFFYFFRSHCVLDFTFS